jgi:hypothetical protein
MHVAQLALANRKPLTGFLFAKARVPERSSNYALGRNTDW